MLQIRPKVRFIIEEAVDITLVDATGKELNMLGFFRSKNKYPSIPVSMGK
jgi:hypothetical protein